MIASGIITKSLWYFIGPKMPVFARGIIILCTIKKKCCQLNYDTLLIMNTS